jgi:hypothetical protein
MAARGCAALVGLVLAVLVSVPTAADGTTLGVTARLASPAFPSPVSAARGAVAWVAASGSGHRFEVIVRERGHDRALGATSAVGWIDGVKLGTGASGHPIVVYSHCPHSPFAGGTVGNAGTDGCRLWWARLSGGAAHLIAAAPPDTSIGLATDGIVVFAVQPNTARASQPVRVERAQLSGGSAHQIRVPVPDGATIDDISASGALFAFAEAPRSVASDVGLSEIWLDEGAAAPRLIAKISSDDQPIDYSEQFFDGLTVTSSSIYAFLYSQAGLQPPVSSELEQFSLPTLTTTLVPWRASGHLSGDGIVATAFDPSDNRLVVSLFSPESEFGLPSSSCSTRASSAAACPVVESGPVTFG